MEIDGVHISEFSYSELVEMIDQKLELSQYVLGEILARHENRPRSKKKTFYSSTFVEHDHLAFIIAAREAWKTWRDQDGKGKGWALEVIIRKPIK